MRAFIAIELDPSVRAALAAIRDDALVTGSGVRWTKAESLHLTRKLLGSVEGPHVEAVVGAMRAAVAGTNAFSLTARGLGCFPSLRAPRVLWAGLDEEPVLFALAERTERECRGLGFPSEGRAFRSHITLARITGRV